MDYWIHRHHQTESIVKTISNFIQIILKTLHGYTMENATVVILLENTENQFMTDQFKRQCDGFVFPIILFLRGRYRCTVLPC